MFRILPAHPFVCKTKNRKTGGYIHPRDLRRLTSPFSASNEPELMVRRHVILCNFDPLRAIILRDRLLVIVPEGADSLLVDLERRVRGGIEEYENSVFGDTPEEDDAAAMIQRYKKKPSGPLAAKNKITKAVKKSATMVKNAMTRHSNHKAIPAPPPTTAAVPTPATVVAPPPAASAMPQETPPHSTSTAMSVTTSDVSVHDEEGEEFAELESSEWEELKGNDWKELPFELQCADGKKKAFQQQGSR